MGQRVGRAWDGTPGDGHAVASGRWGGVTASSCTRGFQSAFDVETWLPNRSCGAPTAQMLAQTRHMRSRARPNTTSGLHGGCGRLASVLVVVGGNRQLAWMRASIRAGTTGWAAILLACVMLCSVSTRFFFSSFSNYYCRVGPCHACWEREHERESQSLRTSPHFGWLKLLSRARQLTLVDWTLCVA